MCSLYCHFANLVHVYNVIFWVETIYIPELRHNIIYVYIYTPVYLQYERINKTTLTAKTLDGFKTTDLIKTIYLVFISIK